MGSSSSIKIFIAVVLCAAPFLAIAVFAAAAPDLDIVSVTAAGDPANDHSYASVVDASGRYVAFTSSASNFVYDQNNSQDIFVKDLLTGEVRAASTDQYGGLDTPAWAQKSSTDISYDGRYVVFDSQSPLIPEDVNPGIDVYMKDMVTGIVRLVSTDSAGSQYGAIHGSGGPAISADGRLVAFASLSDLLVEGDHNNNWDIFVKDTVTGATIMVSTDSTGAQGNGMSRGPEISPDGGYVVFQSEASNLVEGDDNGFEDIFLKDLATGTTSRVSMGMNGAEPDNRSSGTDITSGGRFVAFGSWASNLAPGDTNASFDIFRRDMLTGETEIVSTSSAGTIGDFHSEVPSISEDGNIIAFMSWASNLVPDDNNICYNPPRSCPDVFVKNMETGGLKLLSGTVSGQTGNGSSYTPSVTPDGSRVVFDSYATDLVAGDINSKGDVFIASTGYCSSKDPNLTLRRQAVHWASMGDYSHRLLSVEFQIDVPSFFDISEIDLEGLINTNGVTPAEVPPNPVDRDFTVKYMVPNGVVNFSTTVYVTAWNWCGNSFAYPAPYPGV